MDIPTIIGQSNLHRAKSAHERRNEKQSRKNNFDGNKHENLGVVEMKMKMWQIYVLHHALKFMRFNGTLK